MTKIKLFAGIDVQIKRGCPYYVIDAKGKFVTNGWLKSDEIDLFPSIFSDLVKGKPEEIAIGIDAPRMPLKKLRNRYFNRETGKWIIKEKESIGRECEVIINSFRIANCQWTNTLEKSPEWMQLGYRIFSLLKDYKNLFEVFPSASYQMFENELVKYEICLKGFKQGVKDMLDASAAAVTVKDYIEGKGCEVGGEDGLGSIILPRKIRGL